MVPPDSPYAWDAHWRAWEVIQLYTPVAHLSSPPGTPTATRGGSTATTDDPPNKSTMCSTQAMAAGHSLQGAHIAYQSPYQGSSIALLLPDFESVDVIMFLCDSRLPSFDPGGVP